MVERFRRSRLSGTVEAPAMNTAREFRSLSPAHRSRLRPFVPPTLGVLSALVALSLAPRSDAAKVRGVVAGFKLLRNPVWMEAQDANHHSFSFREAVPTVPAEARQLYPFIPKELCVAALSADKQAPPPPVLIRIGGGRTAPVTIVVPPLTKLSFQNTDPFPHRLYGANLPSFSPSDTGRGANRDWTVPTAGVFEIRDEAAPSLRMWVIGDDNVAAIAYPSLKGEFQLSINQPGEYQVQAFFSGKKVGPAIPLKVTGNDMDIGKTPLVVAKKEKGPAQGSDKDDDSDKSKPDAEGANADAGVAK
jgi:hypothetical protein